MKFKFTWGHGVILALACFIIFVCVLVGSIEFSKNSFDLVTDDYYEEEINYQQEIDAVNRTASLKEKPVIETADPEGIKIVFPEEFNSTNTTGRFQLFRANSKDLDINKKTLDFSSTNTITIPAAVLVKGNYTLKLYWKKDAIDYQMETPIEWK
ncbi:MAG: FixH family protein [Flavobacteriaceae bacterium]|jgi:hypothetical protein|nr:FixH family protein [Flavobacteriaceae bacterium]